MLRSNSKDLRNPCIVSREEGKERLRWERFTEKEDLKPGIKEREWVMENY